MKPSLLPVFTVLVAILLLGSPAFAEDEVGDVYKSEPLDFDVTMTKEEFLAQSELFEEIPFEDEGLSYKIHLPKDWMRLSKMELDNVNLSSWVLGEVTKYVSPPIRDVRASFIIRALEMKRYMDVEKWFRGFMSVQGGYISEIKVFSSNLVHAEYNIFEEGKNYLVRAVIQRSGVRVLMSEYRVPVIVAKKYEDLQKWSMSLFRLKNIEYDYLKLADDFRYLNHAEHLYPGYWAKEEMSYDSLDELFANFARPKIVQHRKGPYQDGLDIKKGEIKTLIVAKKREPDIDKAVEKIMEAHEDYNFDSKAYKEIDRGLGRTDNTVAYHSTRVYLPQDLEAEDNQEFWIGISETANSFFIVHMKIPNRYFDYNLWAENAGAFELILRTFRPLK